MLSAAYWLSYLFRFEFAIPSHWAKVALLTWPYVAVVQYAVLWALGVPRFSWRYVGMRESVRIGLACVCSLAVFCVVRVILRSSLEPFLIPFGVLCTNAILAFLVLVGARATRRVYGEASDRRARGGGKQATRTLLIGAGQAGVMVAREIANRPDLGVIAVGFLDDDRTKGGMEIAGLPVLGTTQQLADIAKRKRIGRVLITIANAPGSDIRRIALACNAAGLESKIIPGIYEIVGDQVNVSRMREVGVEDLLGRAPVQLDEAEVRHSIEGEVVMVTGAGGSIGSELCRQVARFAPKRLVLVERFENALFEIHRELRGAFPDVPIVPHIADVTDARRMEHLFAREQPASVFHAAAHKHVPMMEDNPGEAVKNNVGGTRLVADLADKFGVQRFVLVSTDKAVNPTSVMGTTKRVAEIYVQALSQRSQTRFVTVRFGNVLGSNGSVIPIFKEQIARGGPVTVTHADMKRYFMTIPEASQLVIQAGAMGSGGEIFILDMGEPVKIIDLARDLITLSGLRPHDDIAIEITGLRPGEKLFEELSTSAEAADKTKHPKIFVGRIAKAGPHAELCAQLDDLFTIAVANDGERLRVALGVIVPEYSGGPVAVTKPEPVQPAKPRRPDDTGSHAVAL
ncbi:MAG TPA: nucleoside-diphosphate sugar epimerase/dehydratase [Kofleriaceae bacterium]